VDRTSWGSLDARTGWLYCCRILRETEVVGECAEDELEEIEEEEEFLRSRRIGFC